MVLPRQTRFAYVVALMACGLLPAAPLSAPRLLLARFGTLVHPRALAATERFGLRNRSTLGAPFQSVDPGELTPPKGERRERCLEKKRR